MKKRGFALILSILFCFGMLPTGVSFADQIPGESGESTHAVFTETADISAAETGNAEPQVHWYDLADGWDTQADGENAGFHPYVFAVNEDMTVSASVAMQSALMRDDADYQTHAVGFAAAENPEEITVPAPVLQNATCVNDGTALSATVRFLVDDIADIADIEIYELSDREPAYSMGNVTDNLFIKSIMTVEFDNSTMNLGPDGSGMTVLEMTSTLYPGNNSVTEAGENTLIAVQIVKRINNQYISSPISTPITTTVSSDQLTPEELQDFIPTNLHISAENSTYTLDVTVSWSSPPNAGLVQFYEVENGLLKSNENGTTVYPFDGVIQSTIVPGDGTNPYEYQTINGTNILQFQITKYREDMKQIDEENGVAFCVAEGDTIQTTLWACVGNQFQETEKRSVTYLFSESGAPVSLNSNSTSILMTPEQFTYSGQPNIPDVTVSYEGSQLRQGMDDDLSYGKNVNAGNGTVTVIGKGNYCDNATEVFTIAPRDLTDTSVEVSLLNSTFIYTGNPVQASVSVTYNDSRLVQGTDYEISYSDHTAAGTNTAKALVTGKGNFKGSVTEFFSIINPDMVLPASLSIIDSESFTNGNFTSVVFPASVAKVEQKAFSECENLSHIFFYTDHVEIAENAFFDDSDLTIHCHEGSDAAVFADQHHFAKEYIG